VCFCGLDIKAVRFAFTTLAIGICAIEAMQGSPVASEEELRYVGNYKVLK
jgi:hypothetical protein